MIYAQHFTRMNFKMQPPLQEEVCVILETDVPRDNEEWESLIWDELFKQYPIWQCPYNASNSPPNAKEIWRHGWSSTFQNGPPVIIGQDNTFYKNFRNPPKPVAKLGICIKVTLVSPTTPEHVKPFINAIKMLRGVENAELI